MKNAFENAFALSLFSCIAQNQNKNVTLSRVKRRALSFSLKAFSVVDCSKSVF